MSDLPSNLTTHLLGRIRQVHQNLGQAPAGLEKPDALFSDLLDSMGMVEFLALLAEDFGVAPGQIDQCVDGRFGTVADLAATLGTTGWVLRGGLEPVTVAAPASRPTLPARGWLAAAAARLPEQMQLASSMDEALHRPAGWLESHAGIARRHVWGEQDPLTAAAAAGRDCLNRAGVAGDKVGALLVTSEAPPLLAGLSAALHHRLDLKPTAMALEIGGACTGFLAALWTAESMLARVGAALIIAVEAPSRYLSLQPGPAGEAAALFGDGAAACLLCAEATGPSAIPVGEVVLCTDGSQGHLIQVERTAGGPIELRLDGGPLAHQAVRVMAQAVRDLLWDQGLALADVQAVVAHGGNGRLPALLARQLALPVERVWSETPSTGNLGSASLPVAWAAHQPSPPGPVVWTAVGAGLCWGAALTG
jgi:3-oxoacyl-[acyl-carrier-protein] synthase III